MFKKGVVLFLTIISYQIIFISNLRAQEESKKTEAADGVIEEKKDELDKEDEEKAKQKIAGKISEIAENGTYLKIGDKIITVSKEFLNDSFVSVGDNIEIIAEKTPEGLKAVDYKYIYEEGSDSSNADDDLSAPEEFNIDISGE